MAKKATKKDSSADYATVMGDNDKMALVIPDQPKQSASKILYKLLNDRVIGIDGKKDDPQLTARGFRQFCNYELKRLHYERANVIFTLSIGGAEVNVQRSHVSKILADWADDETDLIAFPEGVFVKVDADMSEQPKRKTVITLIVPV